MTPGDRSDFAKVRIGLGPCPGPDRVVALDALARIEGRLLALSEHAARSQRADEITREIPTLPPIER